MVLVYQAYGRENILRQTQFSILSLLTVLQESSPLRIMVYTDNCALYEDYFKEFMMKSDGRIQMIEITSPQIQKWKGAIDFVHRVKVEILRDAAQKFSGSLFYVDGDTYFRADPTELFTQVNDQTSLMHVAENVLGEGRDPLSKKITKFVRKNKFHVAGENLKLDVSTVMWNAGALGISQKNKELLPLVLELTDQTYARYPKHIMEQLAFSYYLQSRTKIIGGDKVITHYWNQKDEYQQEIEKFLQVNKSWNEAKAAYPHFNWPAAPQPKIKSFWPSWLKI